MRLLFAHIEAHQLPQYHAASRALDALAHALPAWVSRADFVKMVQKMAEVLPYSDVCCFCRDAGDFTMHAPHSASIERTRFLGDYRCPKGHTWTKNWKVNWWWEE